MIKVYTDGGFYSTTDHLCDVGAFSCVIETTSPKPSILLKKAKHSTTILNSLEGEIRGFSLGINMVSELLHKHNISPTDSIEVYSDSRSLVGMLNQRNHKHFTGCIPEQHGRLENIYSKYMSLQHKLNIHLNWIEREKNTIADNLVKKQYEIFFSNKQNILAYYTDTLYKLRRELSQHISSLQLTSQNNSDNLTKAKLDYIYTSITKLNEDIQHDILFAEQI